MLPLSLLRAASGSPLLVELKGGETYNGRLVSCDAWMNMNLTDVICTSATGDRFWKLPSCYIRGSAIKYLRLPPDLLDEAAAQADKERSEGGRGPGGGGGRGPGRGGRRGGRGGRRGGGVDYRGDGGRGGDYRGGGGGGGRGGQRGRGGRRDGGRSYGSQRHGHS